MRNTRRITVLAFVLASTASAGCVGDADPGARVWKKKCAACHGRDGAGRTRFAEGRPFADLTDHRWKHGADLESIRRLVTVGDPASPMPPFAEKLTAAEIDDVSRYVLKLAAESAEGARP